MPTPTSSVIISTYNSPEWLRKVLWGFFVQTAKNFNIIIADDGSTIETRELIEKMRLISPVEIIHVWQEDEGFQKCRILNKAIIASNADYLIFTDGDCIPRADFVEQHLRHSSRNHFLSGGYFKLPMSISKAITLEDIQLQKIFQPAWLNSKGMEIGIRGLKLTSRGWLGQFLNTLIPVKPTWNGHGASCYKECVIAVNGMNEDMQYGGEDVEFGDRLKQIGLKPRRIRFSTIAVHLDHSRSYVTPEMLEKSRNLRRKTVENKLTRAVKGLDQYLTTSYRI